MTDLNITADIIQLRKRPMTPAERAQRYRDRKKAKASGIIDPLAANDVARQENIEPRATLPAREVLSRPAARPRLKVERPAIGAPVLRQGVNLGLGEVAHAVTLTPSRHAVTPSRMLLQGAAFALALVGITMNGWFARSLGSSDVAGWLFLAVGVAADCAALALPSSAARQWHAQRRGAAAAGWLAWAATFAFALSAGIGFASVNIADVTTQRASRVTPAVTLAQTALADATDARNRECKSGTGKFCREREATVVERQQAVDAAMQKVEASADPQVEAATKMVTWISRGALKPTADDFAMIRLMLLSLLPQLGGILLLVSRR